MTLGTQRFLRGYLSHNVRLALFGHCNSLMLNSEVVQLSKKSTLFHLYSLRRIKSLFTLSGLCGVEHKRYSRVHCMCAKVSTHNKDTGKAMTGYIVEETSTIWKIQVANNEYVQIPRGVFNMETCKYTFLDDSDFYRRSITQVWPVLLRLFTSGQFDMTTIRFCYNEVTNFIEHNQCS